jgi:hypothetical protein
MKVMLKKMGHIVECVKNVVKKEVYMVEKSADLFNKHILCGCGWTYYKRNYKRYLDTEHHKEWEDPEYNVSGIVFPFFLFFFFFS